MKLLAEIGLSLVLGITLSACSNPYFSSGAIGGVVGTGVGAGTGAIIGHATSLGVTESTLVGGGIGLPVGILAGVLIQNYAEKKEIEHNNEIIAANARYIADRQRKIDEAREMLVEDSIMITPNKAYRDEIYTGATIGVYNR